MARTRTLRTWRFDYAAAARLLNDLELDVGDRIGLVWNGDFRRPSLAPPGVTGRPAIVIDLEEDWTSGLPSALVVALVDEGVDA